MSVVRRFAVGGPGRRGAARAAGRAGDRRDRRDRARRRPGEATAGVKRHYLGCAGKVANGITTVHLAYVREKAGHALIGARQWIPREQIEDPVKSLLMGLPLDLAVPHQGPAGHRHQHRRRRRRHPAGLLLRGRGVRQLHPAARALRSPRPGVRAAGAVELHPHPGRGHEADLRASCRRAAEAPAGAGRSAPPGSGSKGERWYAWAWLATTSARHHLLIRRHLKTGELAFHYCFVPEGQLLTKARLIRAAGLRWPVEEDFAFSKDCFGLDQCQARLYTAIARHAVLVMAALAICAITAALLRDRTDTQAPPPVRPDQPPPPEPGMIPLTIPEIKRLLAALTTRPLPQPGSLVTWTRRHQARSRWFHKRTRLARNAEIALVS